MSSRLPEDTQPRISRRAQHARDEDLARLDALLVVVPEEAGPGTWKTLPNGAWLHAEKNRRRIRAGSVLSARAAPVVLAPKALLGEGFAFTSAAQAAIAVEALRRQRLPQAETAPPVALRHALVVSANRCGGTVAVVFGR